MATNKLTPKQEAFAWDIANKTYDYAWEAYSAAYNTKNWTKNALYVEACKALAHPKIILRIKELEKKIKDKEKVTLDEIIVKLSQRVEMDIREMFNDDNTLKNIKDLTKEQAMFLKDFEVQEIWGPTGDKGKTVIGTLKKVKMESIKDMLDMLVRHYGGYAKDKENAGGNIEAIRELVQELKPK